jgi:ABC-type uncharacterized transport system substrate-binding protein
VPVEPPAPPPVPAVPARRPPPSPHEVVVLFDARTPGYAEIARHVASELAAERFRIATAAIERETAPEPLAALRGKPRAIVVAVGREAVEAARAELPTTPIVFCQVFNYQDLLANAPIWGVHSVPPLGLQLRSWKTVDASLARVGLIVSATHEDLAGEALQAAEAIGAQVSREISSSDRETLYLFKRLAPQLDGLWLFPDNRILSPDVLQELLSYAVAHRVGVLVFNEALLQWGALLAASSTTTDVAAGVVSVVERVAAGRTRDLPAMTPLSEVQLQLNELTAQKLGLTAAHPSRWVMREPD